MRRKWSIKTVLGLILAILSFLCIILSICQEGNTFFLTVGLICIDINFLLLIISRKEK